MSTADKLLANIFEYKNLLTFLHKNYPEILLEYSVGDQLSNPHAESMHYEIQDPTDSRTGELVT